VNRKRQLMECIQGLIRLEDRFERVAPGDVAWVCERLAWHKLLPLAAAVNDYGKPKAAALEAVFRSVAARSAIREHRYHRQVTALFPLLERAGMAFMPFKGPFWNQDIYPEYAWRHIGDLDLLLAREDARRASGLLKGLGFRPDVVKGTEEEDFRVRGELTLFPGPGCPHAFPVQLHWSPLPGRRYVALGYLRPGDFTEQAAPARWRGVSYLAPRPEVQLLYLALHAACQHQFKRMALVATLAHVIRLRTELDWEEVFLLARERGSLTPLHYALRFVHAFAPLPGRVEGLAKSVRPSAGARAGAALLRPRGLPLFTERRGKFRRQVFYLAMSW